MGLDGTVLDYFGMEQKHDEQNKNMIEGVVYFSNYGRKKHKNVNIWGIIGI